MSLARLTKTPGDVLDYEIDYSIWLGADTISTSVWTHPQALTKLTSSISAAFDTVTIWLSGGKVGSEYKVTNTIVTVGGRTKVTSFDLAIQDA